MERFACLRVAALLAAFGASVSYGAEEPPEIVLAEPEPSEQPKARFIRVLEDGTATLHLQLPMGGAEQTADLEFDQPKAEGGKTGFVGFAVEGGSGPLAYRRGVKIGANGIDLPLIAVGLDPGVDYKSKLSATLGQRKTLRWDILLNRSVSAQPFTCLNAPQSVMSDGSVPIDLPLALRTNEKTASLRLSPFISGNKEVGEVGFIPAKDAAPGSELKDVPIKEGHLLFQIQTAGLTEGSTYSGRLALTLGNGPPQECALELQMPAIPKGELVFDQPTVTRQIDLPWLQWCAAFTEKFRLNVWEKTGTKRVDGIKYALDGASEAPEGTFDLGRHASIVAPERLGRGEKQNVDVTLQNLEAGKYTFTLAFSGNSGAPAAKVPFTINVRHSVVWAVIAVLAALTFSYFLTKGIVYWRERIAIRRRIAQISQSGLGEYAFLPSYTFLSAALTQSARLISNRRFLPPPESVKDHLDRAERVKKVLQKYGEVQDALQDIPGENDYMKHHYRNAIDETIGRVGVTQPLDQTTADKVIEELQAIITRLEEPKAWYWTRIQRRAAELKERAALYKDQLAAGFFRDQVDEIFGVLDAQHTEPGLEYDTAYWRLDLLYMRRDSEAELQQLHEAFATRGKLDAMFRKADELAWRRLLRAGRARVSIDTADRAVRYEALTLIKFAVQFDDRVLGDTFLVRHGLDYEWTFVNDTGTRSGPQTVAESGPVAPPVEAIVTSPPDEEPITSPPVTSPPEPEPFSFPPDAAGPRARPTLTVKSPRVTRFAMSPGKLKVSLRIRWRDQGVQFPPPNEPPLTCEVDISKNTEIGLTKSVDRGEVLVMVGVGALALLTSLAGLWHNKPTFGSFTDYVAILTWAFSIDQGKNLLQLLDNFGPKQSGTGSP